MSRTAPAARRLVESALAALLIADCLLCRGPLPWRQEGGVCHPCWDRLPWRAGARGRGPLLRAALWAAEYEGPVRRLIHALKFEGIDRLADRLGRETASRLAGPIAACGIDLVVPVPLHWWRRFRRGFNQSELIGAAVARAVGRDFRTDLLRRPRPGRRQVGLSRRERLAALAGCYSAAGRGGRPPAGLKSRRVLLVDDVITTGATLEAAGRALLDAGAGAVVGCAVARTPRRIRD